jgi:MoaA/NifB/PqqE/SkfB family radical SAM enzyme
MKEITFELTNYCEHECKYCSSNAVNVLGDATFLSYETIFSILQGKRKRFDRINISGGEPLAHPDFYRIYMLCKEFTKDIVVYSNLITHRRYNANVIDGVYLEADITVTPETDTIHILRRVKQGKEEDRPEVFLSRNHFEDCECEHRVIRPNGTITKAPCNKYEMEILET